jgi:putative membrane protein
MFTDFLLAALHHLLVFALVAMLVTQHVLLRMPMTGALLQRLARLDAGYGGVAGLLLLTGLVRVFHGIKGYDFYLHNPWFHAKLGAFVLAALLSLVPTIAFRRWRRALKAAPGFLPGPDDTAKLARIVRLELVMVAAIFLLAAGVARHGGL